MDDCQACWPFQVFFEDDDGCVFAASGFQCQYFFFGMEEDLQDRFGEDDIIETCSRTQNGIWNGEGTLRNVKRTL